MDSLGLDPGGLSHPTVADCTVGFGGWNPSRTIEPYLNATTTEFLDEEFSHVSICDFTRETHVTHHRDICRERNAVVADRHRIIPRRSGDGERVAVSHIRKLFDRGLTTCEYDWCWNCRTDLHCP